MYNGIDKEDTVISRQGVLADTNLFFSELALTACHLDRFLFAGEDAELGFCLHHGSTRKQCKQPGCPLAPDIYICENLDHYYGAPVAFGDIKLHDLKFTTHETGLYCTTSCLANSGLAHRMPIYIGLPCSRKDLELYVYIENKYSDKNDADGHSMWQIPVVEGATHSKELLCALYCGVCYVGNTRLLALIITFNTEVAITLPATHEITTCSV